MKDERRTDLNQSVDPKLFGLLIASVKDYAILMVDPEGYILSWNKGAEAIKGYSEAEVIGKHISIFYTEEDKAQNSPEENLRMALQHGSFEREGWRVRKNGSVFWADVVFTALYDDEHKLLGFAKVTRDITDAKIAAEGREQLNLALEQRVKENTEKIIENEQRFRALIENSYEGISLLDKNFNTFYRSPSAVRIAGWNDDEREQYAITDLVHPEDVAMFRQALVNAMQQPRAPVPATYRARHKNGHYIWLECVYINMLADKAIGAIVCNFRDVTERKLAEDNLQKVIKELSDYKYALDEAAIVAITDQRGIIKHVNQNFCRISKFSEEELMGQDHRIINSGWHDKEFIRDLWHTIANGNTWRGELKNRAKDGSIYWVDTTIIPFLNQNGKPYQYLAIRSDITERKKAEELLKDTVKELSDYKYALDESAIVAITDQRGIIKHVNQNFCRISKFSEEELMGQDHRIINSGWHDKEFIRDLWRTIANGNTWRGELKNRAKDGSIYWVDTTIIPFLNQNGKPYQYLAIRSDITERKKAEELLKDTVKELSDYKYALDESAIVAITDQRGIIKHVNQNFCRISKFSEEELMGQDHRIINSGWHDKEFIRDLWRTIAKGNTWRGELKNRAKDGSIYWVDTTIIPFLNQNGRPYQYLAIRSDITERKKAEELLRSKNEQIENILESINDGFITLDRNLCFTYANSQFGKMTGVSPRKIVGKYIWDIFKAGSDRVRAEFDRALAEQRNVILEDYYGPLDLWAEDRVYASEGGLSVFVRDITERKKAEELLRSKNEQIENILERIADGFVTLDTNLRYTYANKRIGEMAGISPADMIGKRIWDVFPEAAGTPAQNSFRQALDSQQYICFEDHYARLDLWVEEHLYPSAGGLSVFARDISARKKAEREIMQLNESLEQKVAQRTEQLAAANRELEAFSYSVSHDLRTPLRAVSGFAMMLKDGYETMPAENCARFVNIIMNNAKLMGQLIDDLLDFSRLGRKEIRFAMVDTAATVNECITSLTNENSPKYHITIERLPACQADSSMIKQVWMNLISNAMKYSAKNPHPAISIGSKTADGAITYFVKDNGVGFDMKYAGKLFGVFQRLHRKDEFEGTGVGLALVKRVIDRHNGQLWAQAKPGKGACFYFSLPITQEKI